MRRDTFTRSGSLLSILVLLMVLTACASPPSAAQKEAAQKEPSEEEPTKQEPTRKEATKREATKKEAPQTNTSEKKSEGKDKKQSQEQPTAQIRDTVRVGDALWAVRNAWKTNRIEDTYGGIMPPKQGNFVVVDFRFKNDGSEPKTLHTGALQLVDSTGRKSDPDTDTFGYIPNDKNIFLNQVNPGVKQDGMVIFSVAPNGSGYKLLLKDTNLFRSASNQAQVDLGF